MCPPLFCHRSVVIKKFKHSLSKSFISFLTSNLSWPIGLFRRFQRLFFVFPGKFCFLASEQWNKSSKNRQEKVTIGRISEKEKRKMSREKCKIINSIYCRDEDTRENMFTNEKVVIKIETFQKNKQTNKILQNYLLIYIYVYLVFEFFKF